jgi:pyridoxine kinase
VARILALSSQVARGHVGLSIIVPALQALGHEVIALPTVVLSNHPGHPHVAGTRIAPDVLAGMLGALEANGWLAGVDGILTGYLPSVEHVAFAASAVARVRNLRGVHAVTYLCDPVLGDDPKGLYIDRAAAEAVRDQLVPVADIVPPNRFELSFLTNTEIRSARKALAADVKTGTVFATSIPSEIPGETLNVLSANHHEGHKACGSRTITRVPLRPVAPNGTGDLFSALVLSSLLDYRAIDCHERALAFATAGVDRTLDGSAGRDQLLIAALPRNPRPQTMWPVEQL